MATSFQYHSQNMCALSEAPIEQPARSGRDGSHVTRGDVVHLLNSNQSTKHWAKDIGLAVALAKALNATIELAKDGELSGGKLALGLAKKGMTVSKVAEKAGGGQAVAAGNQVAGQVLKTISLTKLGSMTSPTKAAAVISITVAEKVVMAAGMGEFNKCRLALGQLALTTGATALTAATGVGAVVGSIAIASDLFNLYGQCYADGRNGRDLAF